MKSVLVNSCFFLILTLTNSCVKDDDLFAENEAVETTPSIALVTAMEKIKQLDSISETALCFKFVYPIAMSYNTDVKITIADYEGLQEVIKNQMATFHIAEIGYPFNIVFNGLDRETLINDEKEFTAILGECEFITFRKDFDTFSEQCFELNYPITLIDEKNTSVILANKDAYISYVALQGETYQPLFKFPISVNSGNNINEINSYFEFYQILNTCSPPVTCPELFFTKKILSQSKFEFNAIFAEINTTDYGWYINDQLIETERGMNKDNTLVYEFLPGTYSVCIKPSTAIPPGECSVDNNIYCSIVVIEESSSCPELAYSRDGDFLFADFIGIDTLESYSWLVDSVFVEEEGVLVNGDNKLNLQDLEPGTYDICLTTESPTCNLGTFCETVVVL